jgi:hypothetical protein
MQSFKQVYGLGFKVNCMCRTSRQVLDIPDWELFSGYFLIELPIEFSKPIVIT